MRASIENAVKAVTKLLNSFKQPRKNRFLATLEHQTEEQAAELIEHIEAERQALKHGIPIPQSLRDAIDNLSSMVEANERAISLLTSLEAQRQQ
jgi:translation initiation factor 2B subunit (eIF-2B alpha/beta/delta family)